MTDTSDIADKLDAIALSISEHIANGTATSAIQEQAQRLRVGKEPPAGSATDSDPNHVLMVTGDLPKDEPATALDNTSAAVVDGPPNEEFTELKKAAKKS